MIPRKIYLQYVGDSDEKPTDSDKISDSDVTWSRERIFSTTTNQRHNQKMKTETKKQTKAEALAKFLNEDLDAISETTYDDDTFDAAGGEYLVLTDEEADQRAHDYIKDSLWAFNSSFLASYCDLPEEMFKAVQDKCESGNDAVLQCVERAEGGLDGFVEEAISADGRGHFLSQYDGEENEEGEYFIYRTN